MRGQKLLCVGMAIVFIYFNEDGSTGGGSGNGGYEYASGRGK